MFKISQDVTNDNDLYLHIRRKIVTFSQQAKNTTNHISTHKCTQIKPQSFKQFEVKALKGLKNGAVFKIDYNAKGIPEDIIPVLDTFIAGKCQKFIGITLINQSDETKWIPQGQHIGTVHLEEGRMPSEEEAQEIIHQLRIHPQEVDKMNTGNTDDFITINDQVQMKKPVQHQEKQTLSPEMKRKLDAIIDDYSDIFSKDQYDISQSTHSPVEIPTEGPPCISTPYTIPLKFKPWTDNTIHKLLEAGMIQHTMGTWASPMIIVPKKRLEIPKDPKTPLPVEAKLRLVCDYCKLNRKVPADFWSYDKEGWRIKKHGINAPYPLPCIDEMLVSIQGHKFLTTLDCTGAFHGLRLSPDAAKKSAFITHLGKFEWNITPFGLALLPSYYSKAMQDTLSGLEDFTRNYMDNVLITSYTENEHLDHIRQVFECFCKFKMKLKLAKCKFGRSEIQFLGHIINHEGIRTLPEKTKEISKIKAPRNADIVRAFLGLLNYYHGFIPAFADLMHPIQKLLKKNVKSEWTEECDKAFRTAKETLMRDPILYHPDPNTPCIIETDASKTAFAGVLLQPHTHNGIKQEVPVTFTSYNFTGTQQVWSATECELYAIYIAMCKLSYMIKGGRVTIRTDHKLLLEVVAGTAKSQNMAAADKFHCWTSDILVGDPHPMIQYKKGSLNLIADSLSRLRTGEHYNHDIPLHNTEPIVLKEKAEVNMVITHAKLVEQEQLTLKLPDLQIRVRDIFKTLDKHQLIMNAEKVLDSLDPAKLRELQD